MIDTHAHLQYDCFSSNLGQVFEQAAQAGVTNYIVPGIDIPSSYQAIELARTYERIKATIGVHPYAVIAIMQGKSPLEELLKQFEVLVENKTVNVVAIGECGLDYHYFKRENIPEVLIDEHKSMQKTLLSTHIDAAKKHKLPIILHTRDSEEDTLAFLQDCWREDLNGHFIFHCCPAHEGMLAFAQEHSCGLGVDGDVTYDKRKQDFVKKIPLELLLLETDSPYLMPDPIRQEKRFPNEPANLSVIAEQIALLKDESLETIQNITTENARRIFNLI